MTISISVSVNGNYKVPVRYKQGDREVSQTISGRDLPGPNVLHIPFYHGPDALALEVGPETPDAGEES